MQGRHTGQLERVSFAEAFRFWIKLGFISFGGPAGQIAVMHRELVERRRWISNERFLHALNYCMLLPGPEAQQLATYIGWLMHGTRGGVAAGVFFVLPAIFILLGLSYLYAAHGGSPVVSGVLAGFKPVVVAIVVEAVLRIGRRALRGPAHLLIAASAFVAIYFLQIPFPLIVLCAAVTGLALARFRPAALEGRCPDGPGATGKVVGARNEAETLPLQMDDDLPALSHTLPSHRKLRLMAVLGLVLWVVPLAGLTLWRGWGSVQAEEYRFFSKAAFVTFGGAYAVLAYVAQEAVGSYGWLTHAQTVDGLALAETTPGPLIMVLQFVGFMAGWNHPEGMSPASGAVTGALVAVYATFLPCFFFILLGGPYIEVLRGNTTLSEALSAVTSSVVGVVLNLALVFGAAVIRPQGLQGSMDWFAVTLAGAAFLALYRFRSEVVWVVAAGGLAGLARTYLAG